jgi:hypothetical protein
MITANKSKTLLLGKKISRTSGATATDPSASTYIVDGETVVVATGAGAVAAGTVLNSTTVVSEPEVVIVQSQGTVNPPIKSDVIVRKNVTAYKAKVAITAVEQVTAIGYDGTTSTLKIDPISSNQYIGRILLQGEQNTSGNRDMYKQFDYMSDASATQSEIAQGIQTSLIANFKKMPDRYAKFEMIASATSTSNASTFVAVYGSTVVTTGSDISATAVAGSFLRFAAGVAGGTAAVYEVASSTSTTVTLTVPYQGASASFLTNTVSTMTSAIGLAGNFGVKITGVAKSYSPGKFRYYKNRFKVLLTSDFGTTTVTYITGANEGSGTTEQIQDLEWLFQGGNIYRVSVPPFVERANAVTYLAAGSGTGWSQVVVDYFDQSPGGVGVTEQSRKSVIVGAVTTTNGSAGGIGTNMEGAVTSIMDVLNAWLSTGTGNQGFPTQSPIV